MAQAARDTTMETPAPQVSRCRPLTDTLELTSRALACPLPVDAAIPLDGFEWDPASGRFVDHAAGYVFDPASSVFTQTRTQDEYVFDKEARLFRPCHPQPAEGGAGWLGVGVSVPRLKLDTLDTARLKHELSNTAENTARQLSSTAESLGAFVGQLSRRISLTAESLTPRASLTPGGVAATPEAAAAVAAAPRPTPASGDASGSGRGEDGGGIGGGGGSSAETADERPPPQPSLATPATVRLSPVRRGGAAAGAPWPSGDAGGAAGSGAGAGCSGGRTGGGGAGGTGGSAGARSAGLQLALPTASAAAAATAAEAEAEAGGIASSARSSTSSIASSDPRVAMVRALRQSLDSEDGALLSPGAATDRSAATADDVAEVEEMRRQMREGARLLRQRHEAEILEVRQSWERRCTELGGAAERLRLQNAELTGELAAVRDASVRDAAAAAAALAAAAATAIALAATVRGSAVEAATAAVGEQTGPAETEAEVEVEVEAEAEAEAGARAEVEAARLEEAVAAQREAVDAAEARTAAAEAAAAATEREAATRCALMWAAREEAVAAAAESEAARGEAEAQAGSLCAALQSSLPELLARLSALDDSAALPAAHADTHAAHAAQAAAVSSAEGRLQLQATRHDEQVRQLEFENEELRRATRVKTGTIATLRRELAAGPALGGGN